MNLAGGAGEQGDAAERASDSARRVLIPTALQNLAPPAAPQSRSACEVGGHTMGTSWSAKMALGEGADVAALRHGIEHVLAKVVGEMSQWEPGSDLSRFNASPAETWHSLPDDFFNVLSQALFWAEKSGGAYDPTIGAAVDLWGFGPFPIPRGLPDTRGIDEARSAAGWQRVVLDRKNRRALQPGGLRLDLSAIAKGFAVDKVAAFLRENGVDNALVEIGGELRGEGVKPDGSPWWVEFEHPRASQRSPEACPDTLLALCGVSVATSGDERRFFEHGGRRYAHTLDPRTGFPIMHDLISVTVVAADCMTADVLATALTVLGPERGPKFAADNGYAARFVRFDGATLREEMSPALAAMLD